MATGCCKLMSNHGWQLGLGDERGYARCVPEGCLAQVRRYVCQVRREERRCMRCQSMDWRFLRDAEAELEERVSERREWFSSRYHVTYSQVPTGR